MLPDEIPALGPIPGIDGLFVATGFSGHGPAAGFVMAELAAGRAPSVDLAAFDPACFGRAPRQAT